MFVNAQTFFENHIPGVTMLLTQAETAIPAEFVKRYKRNVVKITPIGKTGYLRRSIITQQLGNTANISWRAPYAGAQNQGFHMDKTKHFVPLKGYGSNGKGYMAMPGRIHYYHKYTDPNTGAHFASIAFRQTVGEMPQVYREQGLTK